MVTGRSLSWDISLTQTLLGPINSKSLAYHALLLKQKLCCQIQLHPYRFHQALRIEKAHGTALIVFYKLLSFALLLQHDIQHSL